ncbi:MAG: cryptochrome/photolyase family protein, partial [Actinobacteria bacterium]|nr:cryptochrome/photolyase family protein [Actinomycetota bacterium]
MTTVLVFGDQLNMELGVLAQASPVTHRILMIESNGKIATRRWHIQRIHLIVASMRRFAEELRGAGYDVDYRICDSFQTGIA